eukprot:scaffold46528_cov72-Cyclotella_meneghiniana.AAC.7
MMIDARLAYRRWDSLMFTWRSYVRQPPSSSELELLLPPKQANGSLNWAMACYDVMMLWRARWILMGLKFYLFMSKSGFRGVCFYHKVS